MVSIFTNLVIMCGIWGYISKLGTQLLTEDQKISLYSAFSKIKHRGPDRSSFLETDELVKLFFGFHRLAIMDKSTRGDQPFVLEWKDRTIYCLCNGEIFNFQDVKKKFNLETRSNSDCEIIPLLYEQQGFDTLLKEFVGEFAFMIVDIYHEQNRVIVKGARDQFGVRPMFFGEDDKGFGFCSELKGLTTIIESDKIKPFPPGSYIDMEFSFDSGSKIDLSYDIKPYYNFDYEMTKLSFSDDELFTESVLKPIFERIVTYFENSVIVRAESDRPTGALLSGGLDSSLVVSVLARFYKQKYNRKLNTFSIGMPGSTDEKYAKMVADYCCTNHTHIEFTTEEFLNAVPDVVWATETHDITTIRASVGQYLVSKWISENTQIKVLYIGDGSDELCSGYMYFHKAPTPEESHQENCKLLRELYLYDVLRADRGIANNGLEARVPFLDYRFVDYYMSIDPRLRTPHNGMEKWLLRSAFEHKGYLPNEVLFRKKEAFSDGVSSKSKSWYEIIQDKAEEMFTDNDLEASKIKYLDKRPAPKSKEALYFRQMFEKRFSAEAYRVIPHYWLPKWCGDIEEPSARILDVYE